MTERVRLPGEPAMPDRVEDKELAALVAELDGPPWARVLRVVGHREAERLMATMGVEAREIPPLTQKVLHRLVQVGPLPNPWPAASSPTSPMSAVMRQSPVRRTTKMASPR